MSWSQLGVNGRFGVGRHLGGDSSFSVARSFGVIRQVLELVDSSDLIDASGLVGRSELSQSLFQEPAVEQSPSLISYKMFASFLVNTCNSYKKSLAFVTNRFLYKIHSMCMRISQIIYSYLVYVMV